MNKGQDLPEWTIWRCKELLLQTDLSIPTIAIRLGISRRAVHVINEKFGMRIYSGKHKSFVLHGERHEVA